MRTEFDAGREQESVDTEGREEEREQGVRTVAPGRGEKHWRSKTLEARLPLRRRPTITVAGAAASHTRPEEEEIEPPLLGPELGGSFFFPFAVAVLAVGQW